MTLKPGPKRIAASTGEPDKRQRGNKKATTIFSLSKQCDTHLLAMIELQEEILHKLMNTFSTEIGVSLQIKSGVVLEVIVGSDKFYYIDGGFRTQGQRIQTTRQTEILTILNKE